MFTKGIDIRRKIGIIKYTSSTYKQIICRENYHLQIVDWTDSVNKLKYQKNISHNKFVNYS